MNLGTFYCTKCGVSFIRESIFQSWIECPPCYRIKQWRLAYQTRY